MQYQTWILLKQRYYCPFLYCEYSMKIGQDFFDIQYTNVKKENPKQNDLSIKMPSKEISLWYVI